MLKLSVKRGRGRPLGSTKTVTMTSKTNSLLKRPRDVPEKRGRGRPRLVRPKAVDIPKEKASEGPRKNTADHEGASRKAFKTPIKISRNEDLLRSREWAAKNMGVETKRTQLLPLLQRGKTVTSAKRQGPTHNANMKKKHMDKGGRGLRKDLLVKKELLTSLGVLVEKRGRGRPRKTTCEGTKTHKKMGPTEVASVTVVVNEKRGRGRPRTIPPIAGKRRDQAAIFNNDPWDGPVQYELCQGMDQFQSPTDFIYSHWPNDTTERAVSFPETSQMNQEQPTERQNLYWETKPLTPERTPDTVKYVDNTLDINSMPHWVVKNPLFPQAPQSPYLGESAPEQPDHRYDPVKELVDFKSQLLSELAATRAEIREGAQLMRSAISGVSAEIHRLGQILQPLVSVMTASNVSLQGHPVAFPPRPPQDTPPDDAVSFTQPTCEDQSSFPCRDAIVARPHKDDCLTEEACLVKMEDAMDIPQPCPQTQTAISTPVDLPTTPTMLLHRQLNSCQSGSMSSVTPTSSMDVPQPSMNSCGGLQGDTSLGLSTVSSSPESPTTKSSSPPYSVDCISDPSKLRSSSSASSSKDSSTNHLLFKGYD